MDLYLFLVIVAIYGSAFALGLAYIVLLIMAQR